MNISYRVNQTILPEQAADIYQRSGLPRPKDLRRIQNMLDNASLVITAWDDDKLVGLLRAMTDFSFDCYLNDLAVDRTYQNKGIGRELVNRLQEQLDDKVLIFLIANPDAAGFYGKMGFTNDFKQVGEMWCMVTGA